MIAGFFSGIGMGLALLLPFMVLLLLVLWILMPILLLRQNRLLLEIRDLLAANQECARAEPLDRPAEEEPDHLA